MSLKLIEQYDQWCIDYHAAIEAYDSDTDGNGIEDVQDLEIAARDMLHDMAEAYRKAFTNMVLIGTYLDEIHTALVESVGGHFTCSEIDSVAAIYALTGREYDAVTILVAHGETDSEPEHDAHAGMDRTNASLYMLTEVMGE